MRNLFDLANTTMCGIHETFRISTSENFFVCIKIKNNTP